MSESAWLIVVTPDGTLARYVSSTCALAETGMTPTDAVALCRDKYHMSPARATQKVQWGIEAGSARWHVVCQAIAAHHATQGVA